MNIKMLMALLRRRVQSMRVIVFMVLALLWIPVNEAQSFESLMTPAVEAQLAQRGSYYGFRAVDLWKKIPASVKAQGSRHVLSWVRARDVSHILPQATHPHLARSSSNVVWELSSINRTRGARAMSSAEVVAARFGNVRVASPSSWLVRGTSWSRWASYLRYSFAKAALAGLVIQGPISTAEALIWIFRHGVPAKDALLAAAKEVGVVMLGSAMVGTICRLLLVCLGHPLWWR